MRLYVSGPMSWRRNHNHHAFHLAAKRLEAGGFDVVDPAALDEGMDTTGWKHSDYLKRDIRHMLDCDGIAVLGSWQLSLGAEAEVALGKAFRWPILTVDEWLYDFEPGGVTP